MKHTHKQKLAQIAQRFRAFADDQGGITRLAAEVLRGHPNDEQVKYLCDLMVNGGQGQNVHTTADQYAVNAEAEIEVFADEKGEVEPNIFNRPFMPARAVPFGEPNYPAAPSAVPQHYAPNLGEPYLGDPYPGTRPYPHQANTPSTVIPEHQRQLSDPNYPAQPIAPVFTANEPAPTDGPIQTNEFAPGQDLPVDAEPDYPKDEVVEAPPVIHPGGKFKKK